MTRYVLLLLALLTLSTRCLAGTLAQFRTIFGDLEVELYDQEKPVTVQNFIRYVESGLYQDGFAHRLVPGFVVQGGGFAIANRSTTNWQAVAIPTLAPIPNEFGVGPQLSNVYGTLAMAKLGGNTNSATSQWFFNLANNAFLDANNTNNLFVVFGKVIRGTNVLNLINNFQYWNGTQSSNLVLHQYYAPPYDDLPLLKPAVVDTSFLFMDITLMKVAVNPLNGGAQEISWHSAAGLTNIVEYTTNFPPAWQTLAATNGNGSRLAVTDNSADPRRFYRVRVLY